MSSEDTLHPQDEEAVLYYQSLGTAELLTLVDEIQQWLDSGKLDEDMTSRSTITLEVLLELLEVRHARVQ